MTAGAYWHHIFNSYSLNYYLPANATTGSESSCYVLRWLDVFLSNIIIIISITHIELHLVC